MDVCREAMVKGCGVAVAMPQGQSWAPPSSSESQWTREPSRSARPRAASALAWAGPAVGRTARDGAEPP